MLCFVQVSQDSVDDFLVLNTGDDLCRSTATTANLDIDADGRPLETHLGCPVPVGRLQGAEHLAGGA